MNHDRDPVLAQLLSRGQAEGTLGQPIRARVIDPLGGDHGQVAEGVDGGGVVADELGGGHAFREGFQRPLGLARPVRGHPDRVGDEWPPPGLAIWLEPLGQGRRLGRPRDVPQQQPGRGPDHRRTGLDRARPVTHRAGQHAGFGRTHRRLHVTGPAEHKQHPGASYAQARIGVGQVRG